MTESVPLAWANPIRTEGLRVGEKIDIVCIAQQNLRVANPIDLEKHIVVVIMGNI